MPMLHSGINAVADRLPKVLTPKSHAIADYAWIGGFGLMGALLWNRNRRAAIAALACSGVGAAVALLTDYAGGVAGKVDLHDHARIEMGLSAVASSLPGFLGFGDEPEARLFRAMGKASTLATAFTDFGRRGVRRRQWKRAS